MAQLESWGRYPYAPQTATAVNWRSEIPSRINACSETDTTLPFGQGRSYGDSCLATSDRVLHMRGLNRMVAADWDLGILTAESGMTLGEILTVVLPKGWFLPVTPGTQYVTLGGAVANDVHGKNHHKVGTFGCFVQSFTLFRSDRGWVTCSSNAHGDEQQLFKATIGGLGLTGVIGQVTLQLRRVNGPKMLQNQNRFGHLDDFFDLADQFDPTHEYGVAWIDCLASKTQLGRGHYLAANHERDSILAPSAVEKSAKNILFTPPFSCITPWTVKAFNTSYFYASNRRAKSESVHFQKYFYPLDGLRNWNRLYGASGFQQYQCILPNSTAKDAFPAILKAISNHPAGSFLSVLKRCGNIPSPGLLSFPMPGVSLALDFAQSTPALNQLFSSLDDMVHDAGGRLYPAKDAHMRASHFQKAYPAWVELEHLRDKKLMSKFWARVTQ